MRTSVLILGVGHDCSKQQRKQGKLWPAVGSLLKEVIAFWYALTVHLKKREQVQHITSRLLNS